MTTLSFSANLAWQFSAHEAAAISEFIEPEHILIGILNLEKISAQDEELSPSARQSLRTEQDDVSELLRDFELFKLTQVALQIVTLSEAKGLDFSRRDASLRSA